MHPSRSYSAATGPLPRSVTKKQCWSEGLATLRTASALINRTHRGVLVSIMFRRTQLMRSLLARFTTCRLPSQAALHAPCSTPPPRRQTAGLIHESMQAGLAKPVAGQVPLTLVRAGRRGTFKDIQLSGDGAARTKIKIPREHRVSGATLAPGNRICAQVLASFPQTVLPCSTPFLL